MNEKQFYFIDNKTYIIFLALTLKFLEKEI